MLVRLNAVGAVAELCAGDDDALGRQAACVALFAHSAVPALMRLAGTLPSATEADASDAADRECCARTALAALAALTDVHAPSRAAVADAYSGFSILAAALSYARDDDVLKHAACVVWYLAREDMLEEKLCAGEPRLLRGLIDILSASAHVQRSTMLAALNAVSMLCFTSLANKTAVHAAGGVAALVGVLKECELGSSAVDAEDEQLCDLCASALCNLAANSPRKLPEAIRACGGIDELLGLVKSGAGADSECVLSAVRALAALASCDSLHAALVDARALEVVTPVVRGTSRSETRLAGLLLVAFAYSSSSDENANVLLLKYDIAEHLRLMLLAVMPGESGVYLSTTWSPRGVCMLARMASVHSARALTLAKHGVPALLLQLLAATRDTAATADADTDAVQHCICRALLNFTYEPELLASLQDVATNVIAVLRAFAAANPDTQAAEAANGVLLALGELHDDAAKKAATATAELSADVKAAAASGGGGVGASKQTPHFQVFLSHRRNDARDFARGLYNKFQLHGFTCFLDYEFREELNDLEAIVAACDNFVFILTEHVFDSRWCMRELRAAVLAGVNIVLVLKNGALWEDEEGVRCHEYPPPWLIDRLDEAVRSTLCSNKAVTHSDEYYDPFCEVLVKRLVTPEAAARLRANAQAASQQHAASEPATPATPAPASPLGYTLSAPTSNTAQRGNSGVRAGAVAATNASSAVLEQLRSELQPVHAALDDVSRKLAELRREHTLAAASAPAPNALLELRVELEGVRRELTELRCSQAAAVAAAVAAHAAADGAAQRALALLPAWISAAGVTCCAAVVVIAMHTVRSVPWSSE
jgi:hypothetical protein